MRSPTSPRFTAFALLLLACPPALAVACGGSKASSGDAPPGSTTTADGGNVEEASVTEAGEEAEASSGLLSTPPVATAANFGTYIVLGDSISDRGGSGPFFYDLLHQNDDTMYPAFQGHDLATKFPNIQYVHAAVAGSITATYPNDSTTAGAPLMSDQITNLGTSYPGDILITITIGGNDLNDHAGDAVLGLDGPEKTQFTANLKADLDALTAPGRLGTGKLYILEANIYDATDGQGDWSKGGVLCPDYTVTSSLDQSVFSDWNAIITQAIAAHSGDYLFDIHSLFAGHGFNGKANWFYTDCIHPNTTGHNELRREAWRMITGEVIDD
ncbi:MAG: SGNH/GDSL hydrolase family protein [Polyangiaceae bacterium]